MSVPSRKESFSAQLPIDLPEDETLAERKMMELQLLIGRTISRYSILEKLGGGGMGVVYEAEDVILVRHAALKFLPECLGKEPRAVECFRGRRASSTLLVTTQFRRASLFRMH